MVAPAVPSGATTAPCTLSPSKVVTEKSTRSGDTLRPGRGTHEKVTRVLPPAPGVIRNQGWINPLVCGVNRCAYDRARHRREA